MPKTDKNNVTNWEFIAFIPPGDPGSQPVEATSIVTTLGIGGFHSTPTPDINAIPATGEQLYIFVITAEDWLFIESPPCQEPPDGGKDGYKGTPFLMNSNEQFEVVTWSSNILIINDINNQIGNHPFSLTLTNNTGGNFYWDPQIMNDGTGTDTLPSLKSA